MSLFFLGTMAHFFHYAGELKTHDLCDAWWDLDVVSSASDDVERAGHAYRIFALSLECVGTVKTKSFHADQAFCSFGRRPRDVWVYE